MRKTRSRPSDQQQLASPYRITARHNHLSAAERTQSRNPFRRQDIFRHASRRGSCCSRRKSGGFSLCVNPAANRGAAGLRRRERPLPRSGQARGRTRLPGACEGRRHRVGGSPKTRARSARERMAQTGTDPSPRDRWELTQRSRLIPAGFWRFTPLRFGSLLPTESGDNPVRKPWKGLRSPTIHGRSFGLPKNWAPYSADPQREKPNRDPVRVNGAKLGNNVTDAVAFAEHIAASGGARRNNQGAIAQ